MLALSKLLQPQQSARESLAALVDSLLQRVHESALIDDRREALQQLRDLLAENGDARAALGSVGGLGVLCDLARDCRDDLDQLRAALECLSAAVGPDGVQGQPAAAINAEQLLRSAACVPTLLSLLDDEPLGVHDFYVRFFVLDILKGLLAANAQLLQECVLGAPLGVVRLMGVLGDQEALRNEALLLLQQLVLGSTELQKMAAFEGAFDRVLAILREEGLLEGGIVVQDCLQLLANLLRDNSSNQLMFREMGILAQLLALVAAAGEAAGELTAGSQPCHNLQAALQVITVLILPPGPGEAAAGMPAQRAHNKELLAQQHCQQLLHSLALGRPACPDAGVRAQALVCLAGMLPSGMQGGTQPASQLDSATVGQLLAAALHAADEAEQAAADAVLEAVYVGNAAAQSAAASSLLSPGGEQELASALGSADVGASSRAASVLSYIVRGNAEAKQELARALDQQLSHCTRQLGGLLLSPLHGAARLQAMRLIRLMVSWLPGCDTAVLAFLQAATARPFLVGVVSGAQCSDMVLRGLVAVLLGLCALARLPPSPVGATGVPTAAMLRDVIVGQIGLEAFSGLVGGLRQRLGVAGDCNAGGAEPTFIPAGGLLTLPFYTYVCGLGEEVTRDLARPTTDSQPTPSNAAAPLPPAVKPPPPPSFTHHPPAQPAYGAAAAGQLHSSPAGQPVYADSHAATSATARQGQGQARSNNSSNGLENAEPRAAHGLPPRLPDADPALTTQVAWPAVAEALPASPEPFSQAATQSRRGDTCGLHEEELIRVKGELEASLHDAKLSRQQAEQSKQETAELKEAILKLESELEGLSTAYAMLEAHSREVQAQLEEERAKHMAGSYAGAGDVATEADDQLEDLLVCLGQEEAKVARLCGRLKELGIDPMPIIQDLHS